MPRQRTKFLLAQTQTKDRFLTEPVVGWKRSKIPLLMPCTAAEDVSSSLAPSAHLLEPAPRELFLKSGAAQEEPSAPLHSRSSAPAENEH